MTVFKTTKDRKKSKKWYGKIRLANGKWSGRIPLYTDKTASQRELERLQREEDQRAAGIITPELERLKLPLSALLDQYRQHLAVKCSSQDHKVGAPRLVERLFDLLGWKAWSEVNAGRLSEFLCTQTQPAQDGTPGWTKAYCNTFIKAAKAFARWAAPSDASNPLAKLPRFNMKGARQTKARRAATRAERPKLLAYWHTLAWDRCASYMLAMMNGLRRNEIEKLTWDDVHLDAPIPFLTLRQKMGETTDTIAMHPELATMMKDRRAEVMALGGVKVITCVPADETVRKDVGRAGVEYADAKGHVLCLHAFRHTFCTMLGEAGVPEATRKALMRHAGRTVTDGYTHSELAAQLDALNQISLGDRRQEQRQIRTGTDAQPLRIVDAQADHREDQTAVLDRLFLSAIQKQAGSAFMLRRRAAARSSSQQTPVATAFASTSATRPLPAERASTSMRSTWPDTQVD